MENYQTTADIFDYWSYGSTLDYNSMELSNEVSSSGGAHSIKMHYKGYNSVSYGRKTQFAKTVLAKGVCLDIKGDGKATVYLNLNWRSGTKLFKMRFAITELPTTWTHYELGFSLFKDVEGTSKSIAQANAKEIESISFGIVTPNNNTESDIYVDNIRLLNTIGYTVNTRTAL